MVGGAALATASLIRPREARAAKSMTVVLESELTILDPHVIKPGVKMPPNRLSPDEMHALLDYLETLR